LDGVYGRIVEAREDYEAGIGLIVAGEDAAGENLLAAATTRMTVAARECARTPGCDAELVAASARELAASFLGTSTDVAPPLDEDSLEEPLPLEGSDAITPAQALGGVSLLTGADLEQLVPLNSRVLAQLNAWLTWKRPDLVVAYENYRHLRGQVAPVYEEAGLPEALLFGIMATESGVKVHAYSRAGAVGPLQFMSATARRYGLRMIDGFDTRLDPLRATRASAKYLNDHLARFQGSLELTLAAYNAGGTRIRAIQRRHRGAGFWDARVYYSLPLETRTYVPRVLAAAWLFRHAPEYGLGLPADDSTVTTVRLGTSASLGEIAICLGNEPGRPGWFRTLRNLNPRVSPAERLPAGARIELPTALVDAFAVACGEEMALAATARILHDAEYPEKPEVIRYMVRRGDTLAAIAGAHRSSVRELAALNGIRPPDYVIHPGQKLVVPARD
jgi:membrane-bound lytic murein transglycosylase D